MIFRMELSGSSWDSGPPGTKAGRGGGTRGGSGVEGTGGTPIPRDATGGPQGTSWGPRPVLRGAVARSGPATARSGPAIARSTSWRMILPPGPLPETWLNSRPFSLAMRRANGDARTRPSPERGVAATTGRVAGARGVAGVGAAVPEVDAGPTEAVFAGGRAGGSAPLGAAATAGFAFGGAPLALLAGAGTDGAPVAAGGRAGAGAAGLVCFFVGGAAGSVPA